MDFKICMMVVVAVFAFGYTESKPIAELQHLPPKPGYVPVYIRLGDTPLYEINSELAEAFREQRGVRPEEAGRALSSVDEETKEHHSKEDKTEESVAEKQSELSLDDLGDIGLAEGEKAEKVSEEPTHKKDSLDKLDDELPLSLDNVDTSESKGEAESSSKSPENSVHIQKIPKTKKHQS